MNNKTNIRHWHNTYNDWLRALDFYKGEIEILEDRLTEIAGKNTGHAIAVQVAHFQNAFTIHRNNIDELNHYINLNMSSIAQEAATQAGFVSSSLLSTLEAEKQHFMEEERAINELRHAFNLFCAEWL